MESFGTVSRWQWLHSYCTIKACTRTGKGEALRASELSECIGPIGPLLGSATLQCMYTILGCGYRCDKGIVVQLQLIAKRIQQTAAKSIDSVRGATSRRREWHTYNRRAVAGG